MTMADAEIRNAFTEHLKELVAKITRRLRWPLSVGLMQKIMPRLSS